jgi:hypothetical protein
MPGTAAIRVNNDSRYQPAGVNQMGFNKLGTAAPGPDRRTPKSSALHG